MIAQPWPDWIAAHATDDVCDLGTTGRRSGRPHVIEIWFGVLGDEVCIISGNGASADWFRNIQSCPDVVLRLGEETRPAIAHVVTDGHRRREIGDVMGAKYPWSGDPSIGLTFDDWCYEVPAIVIDAAR